MERYPSFMAVFMKHRLTCVGCPAEVTIGVGKNPGILISGHGLKDMEELLKQTEGTGVDVYNHGGPYLGRVLAFLQ